MNKYQNGKIYKIVDVGYNKCYIGSTCESLSKRLSRHKIQYNAHKQGKYGHTSSFVIFDEFGFDNCKIELLEKHPCESKEELRSKEGQCIREHNCVNKVVVGRTSKEYYEEKKDELLEKQHQYYRNTIEKRKEYDKIRQEKNKDTIKEKNKIRYNNNREAELKKQREYRKNNTEKIREKDRQTYQRKKEIINRPFTCECGTVCLFRVRLLHFKSKKHQQFINQSNPQE